MVIACPPNAVTAINEDGTKVRGEHVQLRQRRRRGMRRRGMRRRELARLALRVRRYKERAGAEERGGGLDGRNSFVIDRRYDPPSPPPAPLGSTLRYTIRG